MIAHAVLGLGRLASALLSPRMLAYFGVTGGMNLALQHRHEINEKFHQLTGFKTPLSDFTIEDFKNKESLENWIYNFNRPLTEDEARYLASKWNDIPEENRELIKRKLLSIGEESIKKNRINQASQWAISMSEFFRVLGRDENEVQDALSKAVLYWIAPNGDLRKLDKSSGYKYDLIQNEIRRRLTAGEQVEKFDLLAGVLFGASAVIPILGPYLGRALAIHGMAKASDILSKVAFVGGGISALYSAGQGFMLAQSGTGSVKQGLLEAGKRADVLIPFEVARTTRGLYRELNWQSVVSTPEQMASKVLETWQYKRDIENVSEIADSIRKIDTPKSVSDWALKSLADILPDELKTGIVRLGGLMRASMMDNIKMDEFVDRYAKALSEEAKKYVRILEDGTKEIDIPALARAIRENPMLRAFNEQQALNTLQEYLQRIEHPENTIFKLYVTRSPKDVQIYTFTADNLDELFRTVKNEITDSQAVLLLPIEVKDATKKADILAGKKVSKNAFEYKVPLFLDGVYIPTWDHILRVSVSEEAIKEVTTRILGRPWQGELKGAKYVVDIPLHRVDVWKKDAVDFFSSKYAGVDRKVWEEILLNDDLRKSLSERGLIEAIIPKASIFQMKLDQLSDKIKDLDVLNHTLQRTLSGKEKSVEKIIKLAQEKARAMEETIETAQKVAERLGKDRGKPYTLAKSGEGFYQDPTNPDYLKFALRRLPITTQAFNRYVENLEHIINAMKNSGNTEAVEQAQIIEKAMENILRLKEGGIYRLNRVLGNLYTSLNWATGVANYVQTQIALAHKGGVTLEGFTEALLSKRGWTLWWRNFKQLYEEATKTTGLLSFYRYNPVAISLMAQVKTQLDFIKEKTPEQWGRIVRNILGKSLDEKAIAKITTEDILRVLTFDSPLYMPVWTTKTLNIAGKHISVDALGDAGVLWWRYIISPIYYSVSLYRQPKVLLENIGSVLAWTTLAFLMLDGRSTPLFAPVEQIASLGATITELLGMDFTEKAEMEGSLLYGTLANVREHGFLKGLLRAIAEKPEYFANSYTRMLLTNYALSDEQQKESILKLLLDGAEVLKRYRLVTQGTQMTLEGIPLTTVRVLQNFLSVLPNEEPLTRFLEATASLPAFKSLIHSLSGQMVMGRYLSPDDREMAKAVTLSGLLGMAINVASFGYASRLQEFLSDLPSGEAFRKPVSKASVSIERRLRLDEGTLEKTDLLRDSLLKLHVYDKKQAYRSTAEILSRLNKKKESTEGDKLKKIKALEKMSIVFWQMYRETKDDVYYKAVEMLLQDLARLKGESKLLLQ